MTTKAWLDRHYRGFTLQRRNIAEACSAAEPLRGAPRDA
jgi:hypothetical protein